MQFDSGGLLLLSISMAQYQRTTKDLNRAPKLKPKFAMAYNNWGNSYGDMGRLQRGIQGEALQ